MKEIPLTKGKVALVDDEDFEYLNQWKWCFHSGYATRGKKTIRMHRIIIQTPEGKLTDHANGNTLDNRKVNLRACTPVENQANANTRIDNTSGFKGVNFNKLSGRWRAQIQNNGRLEYLGNYSTAEEAAHAYDIAARRIFGEFAKINFPKEMTR